MHKRSRLEVKKLWSGFRNPDTKRPKNDHSKTGRSGFRMLTVLHKRKFPKLMSKMQVSFVNEVPGFRLDILPRKVA
jgi:hypothetical protein